MVEVPRTESLVVEGVSAILDRVAEELVRVGGLKGVLPALRGPFVVQQADEGRGLDESGGRDGTAVTAEAGQLAVTCTWCQRRPTRDVERETLTSGTAPL